MNNQIYYMWTGKFQSQKDLFVMLTTVQLLTVIMRDGVWMYNRYFGCAEKDSGDSRQVIRFGCYELYRIMSGLRRDYVRPLEQLQPEEECLPAGTEAPLQMILDPPARSRRIELKHYTKMLKTLVDDGAQDPAPPVLPEFYLSRGSGASPADLIASPDQATLKKFREHPGYQPAKGMQSNIRALSLQLSRYAGRNRVAFPWRHLYGKGVLVADPDMFGVWRSLDPESRSLYEYPGFEVCFGGPSHVKEERTCLSNG